MFACSRGQLICFCMSENMSRTVEVAISTNILIRIECYFTTRRPKEKGYYAVKM